MTEPDELTELRKVADAVVTIYGGLGCACIKDMPGDNYTCSSHMVLLEYAYKWMWEEWPWALSVTDTKDVK